MEAETVHAERSLADRSTDWGFAERSLALVRLVRPLNVAMFFAGVALGGLLAAGDAVTIVSADLVLAMFSAACIGAGANAINDVFDLSIDRVNRPSRPLPSGTISPGAARVLWGALSVLGLGLAAVLSWVHLGIALGSVGLLYAYSATLKRTPLAGNLAVAAVLALALVYGGLAVAPVVGPVLALGAGFAAATTLAREIAKDVEDAAGDAEGGAWTLPLVAGTRPAVGLVLLTVAVTLVAFPLALDAGLGADFFAFGVPAAGLLLGAAWTLLAAGRENLAKRAGRASGLLKGAMIAGIAALAAARLVG